MLGLLALLAGCERPAKDRADPQRGITNGVDDDGDPAVVALVKAGTIYCTGTLISPRVVLTAAHCLQAASPDAIFFGSSIAAGGTSVAAAVERIHPAFDPATLRNDLALLLLAARAPAGVSPARLLEHPIDFAGAAVRIAGFGSDLSASPPRKRQGTTTISSFDDQGFSFGPNPSQTCRGDSGGPAFVSLDGVEELAGVSSQGDAACDGFATDARVDAAAAEFIEPFLAATAEGSAAVGSRCFYQESCGSGLCVFPSDAPAFGYCSAQCAAGCPAAMQCAGASNPICVYAAPSPGAAGATCAADGDCGTGLCASQGGSAGAACSQLCFPSDASPCAAGARCDADLRHAGAHACFEERARGGCSQRPGGAGGAAELIWLAVAAAARALRRWARDSYSGSLRL